MFVSGAVREGCAWEEGSHHGAEAWPLLPHIPALLPRQDLALCELRGEAPRGHIGLWPEAAFAAHSCAPTATAYSIGDRLLIRAAAEIPKGAQPRLTLQYSVTTAKRFASPGKRFRIRVTATRLSQASPRRISSSALSRAAPQAAR